MASNGKSKFDRILSKLFDARTHGLRSQVWATRGAGPHFTKPKIQKAIHQLQDLAESALLRSTDSKKILGNYNYKRQWHPKRGKGFGRPAKKQNFKQWYARRITTNNCVYVFWAGKRCLYVGRTLNGEGRPSSHFDKHWFGKATRVDVYGFNGKREVPRFECMFTHLSEPSYSRIKPASKKYYTPCPICAAQENIDLEIRSIFRLR